jgi:hypothetical protein
MAKILHTIDEHTNSLRTFFDLPVSHGFNVDALSSHHAPSGKFKSTSSVDEHGINLNMSTGRT